MNISEKSCGDLMFEAKAIHRTVPWQMREDTSLALGIGVIPGMLVVPYDFMTGTRFIGSPQIIDKATSLLSSASLRNDWKFASLLFGPVIDMAVISLAGAVVVPALTALATKKTKDDRRVRTICEQIEVMEHYSERSDGESVRYHARGMLKMARQTWRPKFRREIIKRLAELPHIFEDTLYPKRTALRLLLTGNSKINYGICKPQSGL